MKKTWMIVGLCSPLLIGTVHALAPVVEDSDNFAIIDNRGAARAAPSAQAGWSDEQPLVKENNTAPARYNDAKSNAAVLERMQALEQEVQELRGQLEVQSHQLKKLNEQQLSFYKDLDTRLSQAKSAPASQNFATAQPAPTTPVPQTIQPAPIPKPVVPKPLPVAAPTAKLGGNPKQRAANEQLAFMDAFEYVKRRNYDKATPALENFITKYPDGEFTANAEYWLGECYLAKRDYPGAIRHFEYVTEHYPRSSKVAASTLKLGYALAALGDKASARQKLQEVIRNYPGTQTATLAQAKLQAIQNS